MIIREDCKFYQLNLIIDQIKLKAIEHFEVKGELPQLLGVNEELYKQILDNNLGNQLDKFFNNCFFGISKDKEPFSHLTNDFFVFIYDLDDQRFVYNINNKSTNEQEVEDDENYIDWSDAEDPLSNLKKEFSKFEINLKDPNEECNDEYDEYDDFLEKDEWILEENVKNYKSDYNFLIKFLNKLIEKKGYLNVLDFILKNEFCDNYYKVYNFLMGKQNPSKEVLDSVLNCLKVDNSTKQILEKLLSPSSSENNNESNFEDDNALNQISNSIYKNYANAEGNSKFESILNSLNCKTAVNDYNEQNKSENKTVNKYNKNKGSYYYSNKI